MKPRLVNDEDFLDLQVNEEIESIKDVQEVIIQNLDTLTENSSASSKEVVAALKELSQGIQDLVNKSIPEPKDSSAEVAKLLKELIAKPAPVPEVQVVEIEKKEENKNENTQVAKMSTRYVVNRNSQTGLIETVDVENYYE